jgi:CheY binding
MRKYQSVEKAEVLPEKDQDKISENLHTLGKTSARELSDEERKFVLDTNRVN